MVHVRPSLNFGHKNVIKYSNRPFLNIKDMDNALIEAWNNTVGHDDLVYHLGDFTLGDKLIAEVYFGKLNGHIHVLKNPWHHDKKWLKGQEYISKSGYDVIYEQPIVVLENVETNEKGRGVPVILCHYAFARWERRHYGSYHFFGHSHAKYNPGGKSLDVGIDSAYGLLGEYRPFGLHEAIDTAKLNGENTDDSKNLDQ